MVNKATGSKSLQEQIIDRMQEKETEELIAIWQENDRNVFTDEAFQAIEAILIERLGKLPERKTPSTWETVVTKEGLPRIQSVTRDASVQGAVGSLAAWGAINVGAWFLLGVENREFLSRLTSNPTGGIYFLLYGGLILGMVMFVFAALGFTTRTSAAIFLDGLSLLAVGVWNIIHDFVAIVALRPYGYTVEKPSTIWIMLGICQVVWGFRQFSSFGRIGSWSPAHMDSSGLQELKKLLRHFVEMAEQTDNRIIKASITSKGPLGFDFMSRTTQYTGRLLDDFALMVSAKLDDCFAIDRKGMSNASFSDSGILKVEVEGDTKEMAINTPSIILLKKWSGTPVIADDSVTKDTASKPKQKSDVLACPQCGLKYRTADYQVDAQTWLCSSCKNPLPKSYNEKRE